jgi:hypothetical protein
MDVKFEKEGRFTFGVAAVKINKDDGSFLLRAGSVMATTIHQKRS